MSRMATATRTPGTTFSTIIPVGAQVGSPTAARKLAATVTSLGKATRIGSAVIPLPVTLMGVAAINNGPRFGNICKYTVCAIFNPPNNISPHVNCYLLADLIREVGSYGEYDPFSISGIRENVICAWPTIRAFSLKFAHFFYRGWKLLRGLSAGFLGAHYC